MMSSSLSAFLGEIGRHQLLTPEQELMLGRKVQAMVAITEPCLIAGGTGPSCEYNDNQRFVIRRGERAKNQMITANLRLVVNLACLLYTSPSPRDQRGSRMPSSA